MTKKKSGVNKSAFIRSVLEKDGTATAKVVQVAWNNAGHTGQMNPTLVSIIRGNMGLTKGRKKKKAKKKVAKRKVAAVRVARKKKRRGRKKRGRPAGGGGGGDSFSVSDIQAAKSLASRLGSSSAKRLLDALG